MLQADIDTRMFEVRVAELEARDHVLNTLREIHEQRQWKALGYKSLQEYCDRHLGYNPLETRQLMIALGMIFPAEKLKSDDPETNRRIERLREWRRRKAVSLAVAAFRVVSNRTLMTIAQNSPQTLEELRKIPGIGPKSVENYGVEILRLLGDQSSS